MSSPGIMRRPWGPTPFHPRLWDGAAAGPSGPEGISAPFEAFSQLPKVSKLSVGWGALAMVFQADERVYDFVHTQRLRDDPVPVSPERRFSRADTPFGSRWHAVPSRTVNSQRPPPIPLKKAPMDASIWT